MKNNGKSPTFKFVSGEERGPSEVQRVSRGWRLRGATHSSADLTWIRKWLEIQAPEPSELESVELELGVVVPTQINKYRMRCVGLGRDNLRSHFVFSYRPRHAPEWLRARFLPIVFLANKEELTGKTFTTSLNTTNPNTYVKFIFLRTSPLSKRQRLLFDISQLLKRNLEPQDTLWIWVSRQAVSSFCVQVVYHVTRQLQWPYPVLRKTAQLTGQFFLSSFVQHCLSSLPSNWWWSCTFETSG